MRDEDVGEAELALEVVQQINDLRLDRDVERGRRLVGDDNVGLKRKSARDADALALAAREFMRVEICRGCRQPDSIEEFNNPSPPIFSGADAMHEQGFLYDPPNGKARIQGGFRVLKDHLNMLAHGTQSASRFARNFLP